MGFDFDDALGLGAILNPVGLIGSGLSLGQAGIDYLGEREARGADLASAREQMAFQERMSSTAHQREVADLKAAGLNPVLSANAGASSPVGSSINAENMTRGLSPAIGTALELRRLRQDIAESNSRIDLNRSSKREKDVSADATEVGWWQKFLGTEGARRWLKALQEGFDKPWSAEHEFRKKKPKGKLIFPSDRR